MHVLLGQYFNARTALLNECQTNLKIIIKCCEASGIPLVLRALQLAILFRYSHALIPFTCTCASPGQSIQRIVGLITSYTYMANYSMQ